MAILSPPRPVVPRSERGMALLIVVVVLIVVLAGGLAAISLSSGELSGAGGYRGRAGAQACAQAAVEKIRAKLSNPVAPTAADINETLTVAGGTLILRSGHMGVAGSSTDGASTNLDATSYDAASMFDGEALTNRLAGGGGSGGLQVKSLVATCSGPGFGEVEVQVILRYGVPTGS